MFQGPAVETGQQIDPDQIARIDISRIARAAAIEVRIYMTGVEKPLTFAFERMADAIAFYDQLWSRRTASDDNTVTPDTA